MILTKSAEKKAEKCVLALNPNTRYPDEHPKYNRCLIYALSRCLNKNYELKSEQRCVDVSHVIGHLITQVLTEERDIQTSYRRRKG